MSVKAGRVAIVPKGEFKLGTQYIRLDLVKYKEGIYVAKKDNVGVLPTDEDNWMYAMSTGGLRADGKTIEIDESGNLRVLNVSGVVGIANGGTGANNAADARGGLGINLPIYTSLSQIDSSYTWDNFEISLMPCPAILCAVINSEDREAAYASGMIPVEKTGVLIIFAPASRASAIFIPSNEDILYYGGTNNIKTYPIKWNSTMTTSNILSTQKDIYSNTEHDKVVDALAYKQENLELTEYIADLMYEQSITTLGL